VVGARSTKAWLLLGGVVCVLPRSSDQGEVRWEAEPCFLSLSGLDTTDGDFEALPAVALFSAELITKLSFVAQSACCTLVRYEIGFGVLVEGALVGRNDLLLIRRFLFVRHGLHLGEVVHQRGAHLAYSYLLHVR